MAATSTNESNICVGESTGRLNWGNSLYQSHFAMLKETFLKVYCSLVMVETIFVWICLFHSQGIK
jgi:hypothetical protein